jgi:hypothetical protein
MILESLVIDPFNPFLRRCPYCGREFIADQMGRKFCVEFNGILNYCKDHFHKPRIHERLELRKEVLNFLQDLQMPGPIEDHKEMQEMLHWFLEFAFDNVSSEFAIGGEFIKRIDLCVKENKKQVGIEIKLTSELEGDYSQRVNGLLGQLSYYELIFKNNLIVAYVGDLSRRTRAHFEKVSSALKERGIIVVNIPEYIDELE